MRAAVPRLAEYFAALAVSDPFIGSLVEDRPTEAFPGSGIEDICVERLTLLVKEEVVAVDR